MPHRVLIYAVDPSLGYSDITLHSETCRLMPEKRESPDDNIECPSSAAVGATTAPCKIKTFKVSSITAHVVTTTVPIVPILDDFAVGFH